MTILYFVFTVGDLYFSLEPHVRGKPASVACWGARFWENNSMQKFSALQQTPHQPASQPTAQLKRPAGYTAEEELPESLQ